MKHYVLAVEGGINPELFGPYEDEEIRDTVGRAMHGRQDPATDATFALDVDEGGQVRIETCSFGDDG
jgi:hypothetical protein